MFPPRRRASPFAELQAYLLGLVAPVGSLLLALLLTIGDFAPRPEAPTLVSAAPPLVSVEVAGARTGAPQQALPGDSLSTRLAAAPAVEIGTTGAQPPPVGSDGAPTELAAGGPLIGQVGGAAPPVPLALGGLALAAAGLAMRRGLRPGWHRRFALPS